MMAQLLSSWNDNGIALLNTYYSLLITYYFGVAELVLEANLVFFLSLDDNSTPNCYRLTLSCNVEKIEMVAHHHHDEAEHAHEQEKEQEEATLDPHIWLSPQLVKLQAQNIYRGLVAIDLTNQASYLFGSILVDALYLMLVLVIALTVVMVMRVVGLIMVIALLTIPATIIRFRL